MADPKPWEIPDWPVPEKFRESQEALTEGIEKVIDFADIIIEANETRRDNWRKQFPEDAALIDAEINRRNEFIDVIRSKLINRWSQGGDLDEVHLLVMLGMGLHSAASVHFILDSAKLSIRDSGRKKATSASKKDYSSLQSEAMKILQQVEATGRYKKRGLAINEAARQMSESRKKPISPRTFWNYLKGSWK